MSTQRLVQLVLTTLALSVASLLATRATAQDLATGQPVNLAPEAPAILAAAGATDAVHVLGEDGRVHRLAATTLDLEASSANIFTGSLEGASAWLVRDGDSLFAAVLPAAGDGATVVLAADSLAQLTRLDTAGPLAVDPGRQLLVLDGRPVVNVDAPRGAPLWRYDLARPDDELAESATALALSGADLVVDSQHRLLALAWRSGGVHCGAGGCQRFDLYDLDSFERIGGLADQSYAFNRPPALAPLAGKLIVGRTGANREAAIRTYTADGELIGEMRGIDGQVVTDARNRWTYVLRPRGLWLFRDRVGGPVSVLPFTAPPPAEIQLAPDDSRLYLFGNGWLTSVAVADLQAAGIQPLDGSPARWLEEPAFAVEAMRVYPLESGATFAAVGNPGTVQELYAAVDDEQWDLVDAPYAFSSMALSPSPTFAADGTIVAVYDGRMRHSRDGGRTWVAWTAPQLAFTGERGGNRDIHVLDYPGAVERRVTNSAANDELPAWSPGWTWLTFVSDRTGNADIFAIRADCNAARSDERDCGLVQLTDDPADDLLPAWSPDGRWIAFVSTRDGNPEIYLMRRDGSDLRRLTDDPGGDWRPAWLPDGSGLVFTSDRAGSNDLYRLALDEDMRPGDLTQLTASPGDERDPAVAPDGTIYYVVGAGESLQIASLWLGGALPSAGSGASAIGGNAATLENVGHPAALPLVGDLLFSGEREDRAAIYAADGAVVAAGDGFTGHPAAIPPLWQPEAMRP